jgi:hypothetical protein
MDVCLGKKIEIFMIRKSFNFKGCFNMIQMEINRNLMIVGILAFVLVFVEVKHIDCIMR